MLLFIIFVNPSHYYAYIVSIHLMLLFITKMSEEKFNRLVSFNTSHVTLYPKSLSLGSNTLKFQYISCYSLSEIEIDFIQRAAKFQYISCYSLSGVNTSRLSPFGCFNTSHVTLYQYYTRLEYHRFVFQYISCYSLSQSAGLQ